MSYSSQRATSTGSLVLLTLTLEYFDRSEITVFYDGVLNTSNWAWVGSTEHAITFSPAVPAGVVVTVQRTTDISQIRHSLVGGAAFVAQTLDEDFAQILHIAQEAREVATIAEVFNDLNIHGNRIKNVADGVDSTDAANVAQLQATLTSAQAILDSTNAVYDSFDDRYLGAKSVAPTVDNDGNDLAEGALYWSTPGAKLYAWSVAGGTWNLAGGGGGATGATGNGVFYENDQHVTASYSITAGNRAGSFGPITIDDGVTVTVPDGSVWTIA